MGTALFRSADPSSANDRPRAVARHDRSTLVLIGLELALAVGAASGAYAMFTAGDAAFDGTVTAQQLPLHSWTIAAVSLLVLNAALPVAVALAAWFHEPWARRVGHLVVGGALAGWILVEVAVLGWVSWLQPALLIYAAVIAVMALRAIRATPWTTAVAPDLTQTRPRRP